MVYVKCESNPWGAQHASVIADIDTKKEGSEKDICWEKKDKFSVICEYQEVNQRKSNQIR